MATDTEVNRPAGQGTSASGDNEGDRSHDQNSGETGSSTSTEQSVKGLPSVAKRRASLWQPRTWSRKMIIIASIIMAVVCIVPAVTVPVVLHARHSHHSQSEALSNGLALRIMPLGASITWGTLSTDGNGYRNDLRTNLTTGGNAVNMVGSRKHGTMADSDNEGWPGYVIDQVHDKARTSVPKWKPNVILVNAGTNDCLQNRNVTHAADRMRSMIDDLLVWSPRATIVLSTLIVNKDNKTEARVESVNEDYRALAGDLQANGTHLVLAEMHGSDGPQLADMADQTHPNDTGYAKMAAIWYAALREASNKDWLQQAENVGIPDNGGS